MEWWEPTRFPDLHQEAFGICSFADNNYFAGIHLHVNLRKSFTNLPVTITPSKVGNNKHHIIHDHILTSLYVSPCATQAVTGLLLAPWIKMRLRTKRGQPLSRAAALAEYAHSIYCSRKRHQPVVSWQHWLFGFKSKMKGFI
eukprot:4320818-Amphidinium_carterae.1